MILSRKKAEKALSIMVRSRRFEEALEECFKRKEMRGTTHLSIGQEACQAGLSLGLEDRDWIIPTHRCHGHTIARGADISAMFSEMFGSRHGLSAGLGGSMHMSDKAHCNPGSSAVVASGIGIACGLAFAQTELKEPNISVALFGDGATSRGILHECMNISSLWKLPVLFFCENNGYGMSAPVSKAVSTDNIAKRSEGYRIPYLVCDGNSVESVYQAVSKARERIMESGMPFFIEAHTYRENGHSKNDKCVYRTREEEAEWRKADPIRRFTSEMEKMGWDPSPVIRKAEKEVREALDKARETRNETLTLDEALSYTLCEEPSVESRSAETHTASGREAVREALDEEMERDSSVILLGEDIGKYGGCFKVTGDLYKRHPSQVRETPVSEEGFTAMAVGASMRGIRPVVEIMYGDFSTLVSDAMINHAAKIRFMSAGQFSAPMVLRTPMGCGTGHGSQHTQSLEGMFASVPGLVVVAPSTPGDTKALLKSAIRSPNPVVFCEHKMLYNLTGEVGDEHDILPLGRAFVKREGEDVTVVGYSRSVITALQAAESADCSVEVIDLATLRPMDTETVIESVAKTGRLVVVQESCDAGGYGAAVISAVAQSSVRLKSPAVLLHAKEMPVPFTPSLEEASVPQVADIIEAIDRVGV